MPDPGFVSGFIGVGIDNAIRQIIHHSNIARRCKEQLVNLKDLVRRIDPIMKEIKKYRLEVNRKRIPDPQSNNNGVSALNTWLKELDTLLQRASEMAQQCTDTIPRYAVISRYKASRRISRLISDITQHLQLVPLIGLVQTEELREGLARVEELGTSSTSGTTSATTSSQPDALRGFFISEPLIVGQDNAFAQLEKLLIDAEVHSPFSGIGVLGMGGSGKTLLLKTVFNSKKVRDFFCHGFLLWLTVSESPSFTSLRKQLSSQIAMQSQVDLDKDMNEEGIKIWLHESLQGKRFSLFLDDVWEEGAKLLEELGLLRLTDQSNSKVVVSSRIQKTLLGMGVNADTCTLIRMGDLIEDDSWRLFVYHAFPLNNGNLPENIKEGRAKDVCAKCGGLPLAIKTVGRAMAGIIDAQEWDLAVQRLPNANNQDQKAIYDRLRLSYDALGNYNVNLQLGFLYLAVAFPEDYIITETRIVSLWIGEGVLQDEAGHDSLEIGRIYINILADRCLIEPIVRSSDDRVLYFRMHDVVRSLGIQIAEQEENLYCAAGKGLTKLDPEECLRRTRIYLAFNALTLLPESLRAPKICTLSLFSNRHLREIPRRVIGSMISLKVLDLGDTSIQSLPESIGCLKQLVCLRLRRVPIKKLPASLTNLVSLQILNLLGSRITELPSGIHKLRALTYLSIFNCDDLQCVPHSLSGLTSLKYLAVGSSGWRKHECKRDKKGVWLNDLGNLTQLEYLFLGSCRETISEGTLGKMSQMESLQLTIGAMAFLPGDIINMSKLKKFSLKSSHISKMENKFCKFQNLIYVRLWHCAMLEEIPQLHSLRSLRKLDIIECPMLKRIPREFGEIGAFPMLETFSMVGLHELEELPIGEEGAMPKLKMFTLMLCKALIMLPESYLNLKKLQKIRIYGCSRVLQNLEKFKKKNKKVEMVTMSTTTTEELLQKLLKMKMENTLYGEFWSSEFYIFTRECYMSLYHVW